MKDIEREREREKCTCIVRLEIKGYTTGGSIHIIANSQVALYIDTSIDIDI